MSRKIHIFDTTLRDGEQSPGFSMTLGQKLRVARALADLKVDIIEAQYASTYDLLNHQVLLLQKSALDKLVSVFN